MRWIGDTIDAPMTGSVDTGVDQVGLPFGRDLLQVLQALQDGDFSARMAGDLDGLSGQIAEAVNVIAAANQHIAQQLKQVGSHVDNRPGESVSSGNMVRDGRARQRIKLGLAGGWGETEARLNRLIDTIDTTVVQLAETTAELARSESRLQDSEDGRILALAAGRMGSWDWDLVTGACIWDAGQRRIFGVDAFAVAFPQIRALVDRDDWKMLCRQLKRARRNGGSWQLEFRVRRPDGGVRWCLGTAVAARNAAGRVDRIRGITMDVTERKEAEDRQSLLAREVDHRTKNALAVVHAIVSLTRAGGIQQFSAAVEGRIQALARAHSLLSDSRWHGAKIADLVQGEVAALRTAGAGRIRMSGRSLTLHPSAVQALALALHELAANAARHGALSVPSGSLHVAWEQWDDELALQWTECGRPYPPAPVRQGMQEGQIGKGVARDGLAQEELVQEGLVQEGLVQEGLGLRIVRASVETQLCGSVAFDWRPDGLVCAIRIPCRPRPEVFGNFLYSIQNPGGWRNVTAAAQRRGP